METVNERNGEIEIPKTKYGKLTNDFMFKRIFGTEATKDVLIMFLNQMLEGASIVDVTINNTEHLGMNIQDRRAVFDITCSTSDGGCFIVEMQHASQEFFRDRATYYTSYPTIEQGNIAKKKYRDEHGTTAGFSWDFNLHPVKIIAILSFRMNHEKGWPEEKFRSSYHIREDENGELMHDKHQYIFLELPRFSKNIDELDTDYEKWVFLFKNMHTFKKRPDEFMGKEFDRLFEMAEFANFTSKQIKDYMEAEMYFNDYQNCINYAKKLATQEGYEEGRIKGEAEGRAKGEAEGRAKGEAEGRAEGMAEGEAKGRAEGRAEAIMNMYRSGISVDQICHIMHMEQAEIESIIE